jgi:predicted N-acetyltransferase YhbS
MDIRPLLPAEVDAATEMVLGHGWGVRRDWLAFAATSDRCRAVVAEADGEIVATGVGTANGPVGWVGSVFVAPDQRGRGLGRGVTQALLDWLQTAGCATVVLVATSEGRRLYERMGFDVQTRYRILEAPGIDDAGAGASAAERVRPFTPADLDAMAALDRTATGEDRRHLLERLASAETARVAASGSGGVAGFLVRPPWGGGATVAATREDAVAMITARRRTAGPAGRVRVGVLDENEHGIARLLDEGFRDAWSAPRMARGASIDWRPELIWGQFNHAVG